MKISRWISLVLIAVLLTACAPAAEETAATEIPAGAQGYPAPEVETTQAGYPAPGGYPAPAAGDALPAACKVEGMATYSDPTGRFCFAYPLDFALEGEGLVGPAQEPDAARARLVIFSEALESGKDLAGVVEARLVEYGDAPQRADMQIGGEPAVSLEPVPGEPGSIDFVLVHGGEVITLRFQPNVETYAQARPDRDALVDIVTKSFTWLK